MNKTKCIQYYLDSREYSSKEVLENIEETKKEFTKKKIHVEYRINDFGMYEITFFFENKITIFGKIKLYLKKKRMPLLSENNTKTNKSRLTKSEKRMKKYYNHEYGTYKKTGMYKPY
ncbi:MAG: hypothetical protein V8R81_04970 [Clostridia bacterium]